jgi:ketosteroid isomerase-like protein
MKEDPMMLSNTKQRTEEMLSHHVEAFAGRDMDAFMSDYCENAVLLTPDGAMRGIEEVRAFFEAFLAGFSPGSTFEASQRVAARNIGYVVWSAPGSGLPFATDTLIFSGEKILTQTFTAPLNPR